MNIELVETIREELGLPADSVTDEVIEMYIAEGEKQLKNYTGAPKLTTTLMVLVKKYAKTKMNENGNKYNSRVERRSGLDNVFKDEIGVIDLHKRFKDNMQSSMRRFEKNKKIQRNYAIEQKENMKKRKEGGYNG